MNKSILTLFSMLLISTNLFASAVGQIYLIVPKPLMKQIDSNVKNFEKNIPDAEKEQKISQCIKRLSLENKDYKNNCDMILGSFNVSGDIVNGLTGSTLTCSLKCTVPDIPIGKCSISQVHAKKSPDIDYFELNYRDETLPIPTDKVAWLFDKNDERLLLSSGVSKAGFISRLSKRAHSCKDLAKHCFPQKKCR